MMDDGWGFVRWGLCDPRDGDVFEPSRAVRFGVEQVKAVREACGEELEICVDVHTRLDPPSAVEFCNRIEPYHPYFVEDPLRSEYREKLRHLRQQTSVPIAAGEQYDSKWAFRPVIEDDLLDYCRVDLCIAGGLTEARKIADACETHYVQLAPHNPGGLSPVSTAACLHLCLSSPLVAAQELRDAPPNFADAFPTQLPFEDGHLLPPDRPGLGVELDESALEDAEPYEPSEAHGFERQDGSYTNW
jgi:galactonate dehydratase